MNFSAAKAVGEAFKVTAHFYRTLLRVAAIPYILSVGIRLFAFFVVAGARPANLDQQSTEADQNLSILIDLILTSLPFQIALLVVAVPFATAWYRYCVAQGDVEWSDLRFGFGNRELAYLGYNVVFAILLVLVLIPAGVLGSAFSPALGLVAIIAAGIAYIYLFSRLILVLPGSAVGAKVGFGAAWSATQGLGWRIVTMILFLILVVFGIGIALSLLNLLVAALSGGAEEGAPPLAAVLFDILLGEAVAFYVSALFVTAVAYLYREVMGSRSQPPATTPDDAGKD